ncbi:MAG TPA: response regulator transcription factor [Humibacter sp.]|nr:response regulator transcription factor [Humibacter sp.]
MTDLRVASAEHPNGLRLVIVDDQQTVRDSYVRVARTRNDLEVVGTGASGHDAVRLAAAVDPDVIVMDIRMPGLDGISATRAIVEIGNQARILVMTTFNLDEYVFEALKAGASGFLLKDASPEQFLDAIAAVARGDALIDPVVTRALIGARADRIRRRDPAVTAIEALTPREREVLRLLAAGMSNSEIAAELVVTRETVKTYVSRLLAKLGMRDRVQAVVFAYRTGIADDF